MVFELPSKCKNAPYISKSVQNGFHTFQIVLLITYSLIDEESFVHERWNLSLPSGSQFPGIGFWHTTGDDVAVCEGVVHVVVSRPDIEESLLHDQSTAFPC